MMLAHSWQVASVAAGSVAIAAVVIKYLLSTRRPKDYPPGPPTILGIGNLHQIPLKQPFCQFHEWSKTYGDIIGLKVGPANIVVLHSPEYVRELFDKRGAIYSGRPYSYIPAEHVFREHGDKHILNLQNGVFLRRWRAAVAHFVGPVGLKQSLRFQEETASTLMYRLLLTEGHQDSLDHIKHWALATPLLAITGQRLEDRGKAFADRFFDAQEKWLELLEPGNTPPVDIFPFLRWIPERLADWKTKARTVREYMFEEYFGYLKTAKDLRCENDNQGSIADLECLMTKILGDADKDEGKGKSFTDDEVAYLGGGLLDAAVDTTWATMMSLIMFLTAHPDIQEKAFEEINQASPTTPPTADVLDRLPYVRACLSEVRKTKPVHPFVIVIALPSKPLLRGADSRLGRLVVPRHSACARQLPMDSPTFLTATTPSTDTRSPKGPHCLQTSGESRETQTTTMIRRNLDPRDTCYTLSASSLASKLLTGGRRHTPLGRAVESVPESNLQRIPSL